MKGVLVRVGIDQKYGHWNSPADDATKRFIVSVQSVLSNGSTF